MAEIYLRKRVWWARGRDRHGVEWRKSTKQTDPKLAKVVAAQLEQEFLLDANKARHEATLLTALEGLEQQMRVFKRAEATIEIVQTKGRHLLRVLDKKLGRATRCADLTPALCAQYAEQRLGEGAHPHTVFKELRILQQALRRAKKFKLYTPEHDPGDLMPDELDGAYVERDRWLPENEYRMLLDEFNPRPGKSGRPPGEDRRDYIIIMCQTGVRLGELHKMEPANIDIVEGLLHLDRATKNRKSRRTIPLSALALDVLQRRLANRPKGGRLFPEWGKVQRDLDLACLRIEKKLNPGWKRPEGKKGHGASTRVDGAGVVARRDAKGAPIPKRDRVHPPIRFETVTPNDLRRTFASWLAQAGVPLFHAAKLMGHGSTKMLERVYARLAPENARSAIAMLPASITATPHTRTGQLTRVK